MSGPICEDLNVVEVGSGSIAVSLAGMMLADNGARVVKIEPPEGDALRARSPSGFLVWNRGKDSAVCDLRGEDGRRAVRAMAEQADVLLVGLAPGRADEWGLDDESLRAANPGLVYCAITGFGSTGPYARAEGLRRRGAGEDRRIQSRHLRLPRRSDFRRRAHGEHRCRAHGGERYPCRARSRVRRPGAASVSTRRSCRE